MLRNETGSLRADSSIFLRSVREKDWESFLLFVSDEHFREAWLPSRRVVGANEFIDSQRSYFAGDGVFEYTVVDVLEGADLGFCTLNAIYSDVSPHGESFSLDLRLVLVFRRTPERWMLVYDQNSRRQTP
jgi:ketosteroid isomerase-like protein